LHEIKIARDSVNESVLFFIVLQSVHLWTSNSAWEERLKGQVFCRLSSATGMGCLVVGICRHTASRRVCWFSPSYS